MDQKQKTKLAVSAVTVVVLFVLISATVLAGTTIGTNVTTTGTLNVSNNADFTLGGAKRILIDATTTDATLTTGVVDLNVDVASGSTGVLGQDTTINIIGGVNQASETSIGIGNVTTVNAPSTGLQTNNNVIGNVITLTGTASDESGSQYFGTYINSGGTPGGSAEYVGNFIAFHSTYGGTNLQNSDTTTGDFIAIQKTAGTGAIRGVSLDLDNSSSSSSDDTTGIYGSLSKTAGTGNVRAQEFDISNSSSGTVDVYGEWVTIAKTAGSGNIYGSRVDINNSSSGSGVNISGAEILLDLGSTALSNSIGLYVSEDGSGSEALKDAILIVSNNNNGTGITDAIDVSDIDITNALNIGTNTILASGSSSVDLNNSADDILTITNSNGSAVASLAVEGKIIVSRAATQTLSGNATLNLSAISGYVAVAGSGGAVTLSTSTAISNGDAAGQLLFIEGTSDTNTVQINDNANVQLWGNGNVILGANDIITLIWNDTDWLQVGTTSQN